MVLRDRKDEYARVIVQLVNDVGGGWCVKQQQNLPITLVSLLNFVKRYRSCFLRQAWLI